MTGNESSIDRLMKQISSFMTEIGDEFKIVVVKAIRELCIKYPAKHRSMVNFLAAFLREEGGVEFKKSIVDSIVELMATIPDTKETSLLHLCEFIEDCEFSELIVQILHLIGTAGVSTSSPSRYIRFIFNRVILENAVVRAAAVSTLGQYLHIFFQNSFLFKNSFQKSFFFDLIFFSILFFCFLILYSL